MTWLGMVIRWLAAVSFVASPFGASRSFATTIEVTFDLEHAEWRSMFETGDADATAGLPSLETFESDVERAMALLLERTYPYLQFVTPGASTEVDARMKVRLSRYGVASPAYFEVELEGGSPGREPEMVFWIFRTEAQCAEETGAPETFQCEIIRTWASELESKEDELVERALHCIPVRREHEAYLLHIGGSSALVIFNVASDFRAAPTSELVIEVEGALENPSIHTRVTKDASEDLAPSIFLPGRIALITNRDEIAHAIPEENGALRVLGLYIVKFRADPRAVMRVTSPLDSESNLEEILPCLADADG